MLSSSEWPHWGQVMVERSGIFSPLYNLGIAPE